jgi:phenylalanyl-tRNA synthetase beta chain
VFMSSEGGDRPDELSRLVIILTGSRELPHWQGADNAAMDFYDLKGVVTGLLDGLHLGEARFEPVEYPSFHPGKTARILLEKDGHSQPVGVMGELHPLVRKNYDLPETPLLAAELNLQAILDEIPEIYAVQAVSAYPPVLEDLAVIVDEAIPAEQVAQVIRQAGGRALANLNLFDVYRGEQIGSGKKSLAYGLVYQAADRTLTDQDVLQLRQKILRRLEQELGAKLRS